MSNANIMDRLYVAMGNVLRMFGGTSWLDKMPTATRQNERDRLALMMIWHRPAIVRGRNVSVEWIVGDVCDPNQQRGKWTTQLQEIEYASEPGMLEVSMHAVVARLIADYRAHVNLAGGPRALSASEMGGWSRVAGKA